MAEKKKNPTQNLIILVTGIVLLLLLFLLGTMFIGGAGMLIHGNIHSTGYKQGYIFSVSYKEDRGLANLTKIYKIEVSPLGWGNGLHAGKPGQTVDGGNWAAEWVDDEAGIALHSALSEIPPDAIVRVFYTEHHVDIEGVTRYRVTHVDWIDPSTGQWSSTKTNFPIVSAN